VQVIGVVMFLMGRAATVGVKYALYPEPILADGSEPLRINGKAYGEARLRDRAQIGTYVLNVTGRCAVTLNENASFPHGHLSASSAQI
jgi:hypothetical protein